VHVRASHRLPAALRLVRHRVCLPRRREDDAGRHRRASRAIGTPLVEITGGEPLIHGNAFTLAENLLDAGFTVLVETSGAIDVAPLDPRAHRIMDLKCPGLGRGVAQPVVEPRPPDRARRDQVRHRQPPRLRVGAGRHPRARPRRAGRRGGCARCSSRPSGRAMDFRQLAEWVLEDRLSVRYQIQLHKIIWGAGVTGV
jgi:7-carboxy-7-deazaguanine synthase